MDENMGVAWVDGATAAGEAGRVWGNDNLISLSISS